MDHPSPSTSGGLRLDQQPARREGRTGTRNSSVINVRAIPHPSETGRGPSVPQCRPRAPRPGARPPRGRRACQVLLRGAGWLSETAHFHFGAAGLLLGSRCPFWRGAVSWHPPWHGLLQRSRGRPRPSLRESPEVAPVRACAGHGDPCPRGQPREAVGLRPAPAGWRPALGNGGPRGHRARVRPRGSAAQGCPGRALGWPAPGSHWVLSLTWCSVGHLRQRLRPVNIQRRT